MIRHEFSYWMKILSNHQNSSDVFSLLEKELTERNLLAPAGPLAIYNDNHFVYANVNPDIGTIEESSAIYDAAEQISKSYPHLTIELKELDEEDKSAQTLTIFKKGTVYLHRNARLIDCTQNYDTVTTNSITDWLQHNGYSDIATKIRLMFGE